MALQGSAFLTGSFRAPISVLRLAGPGPISDVPNYIRRSTWSLQMYLRTSTESLPPDIVAPASDCFEVHFRLTLRLSVIVGAEEIQGRSSGVAVIRPVNLLQTSTSIQRKNKPSARWEATSEFEPDRPYVFAQSSH
jgi:hypothetical protein